MADPQMLSLVDWTTASEAYTLPTMTMLQALKQSPRIKNAWCWWLAPLVGLVLAAIWLSVNQLVWWDNGLFVKDALVFYRSVLQGIFGGLTAPIAYQMQKVVPEQVRPFAPGPDNFGKPKI